jgi:hypothetical protein
MKSIGFHDSEGLADIRGPSQNLEVLRALRWVQDASTVRRLPIRTNGKRNIPYFVLLFFVFFFNPSR